MKLRIREIAKEKGMTIKDVAEKAEMYQSALSRILTDEKSNPTLSVLKSIADALGVSVAELFENNEVAGFVRSGGAVHEINSVSDLEKLLSELKGNLEKQTEI